MTHDDDYKITLSPLSQTYTEKDISLVVDIFKGENEDGWTLEIQNDSGLSMIAQESFATDQEAWNMFLEDIQEDGIESFLK